MTHRSNANFLLIWAAGKALCTWCSLVAQRTLSISIASCTFKNSMISGGASFMPKACRSRGVRSTLGQGNLPDLERDPHEDNLALLGQSRAPESRRQIMTSACIIPKRTYFEDDGVFFFSMFFAVPRFSSLHHHYLLPLLTRLAAFSFIAIATVCILHRHSLLISILTGGGYARLFI